MLVYCRLTKSGKIEMAITRELYILILWSNKLVSCVYALLYEALWKLLRLKYSDLSSGPEACWNSKSERESRTQFVDFITVVGKDKNFQAMAFKLFLLIFSIARQS